MHISQRILWVSTITVVLCAGLSFFLGVEVGKRKSGHGTPPSYSAALNGEQGTLFKLDEQTVAHSQLAPNLQKKLSDAKEKRSHALFAADYEYFRVLDKVTKAAALELFVATEAKKLGKEPEAMRQALLPEPEVDTDDARALFDASDPSAPTKDFARIKNELIAYISEVARRENFERLLSKLTAEGRLASFVRRPRRDKPEFRTEGFPTAGVSSGQAVIVNFTDFLCDSCAEYNIKLATLVQRFGSRVRFFFIPFPYSRPDKSMALARGAMCAQAAGQYIDYHMAILGLGAQASEAHPLALAKSAGLDVEDFSACYKKGTGVGEMLQRAQEEASRAGVIDTPVSFFKEGIYEGEEGLKPLTKALEGLGS